MRYVGLDVHWRQSTICVLDEHGRKLWTRTVRGSWCTVVEELRRLPRPLAVCFEASTGYGFLHDALREFARRVVVAHPGQLRLIFRSKRKTDRVDAEKLAKLLYLDEAPGVYVPAAAIRSWRGLMEHRRRLVAEQTRAKNQVRALLRRGGVAPPRGLWGRRGLAWLEALPFEGELEALQRDLLLQRLTTGAAMVRRAERALDGVGRGCAGVALLQTIPGVGRRTAEVLMAYIADPQRFARTKAIGRYFGLVPQQDASAGVNRLGHITREGPAAVRHLLTEAAWHGVRRSPRIRAVFERVRRGDPARRKIAVVATAHYLARVALAMLKTGEVWREEAA